MKISRTSGETPQNAPAPQPKTQPTPAPAPKPRRKPKPEPEYEEDDDEEEEEHRRHFPVGCLIDRGRPPGHQRYSARPSGRFH